MSVAYRSTCRPTLGRYIDRDVSVKIATDISVEISADMSVDISVENRSICRSTVDRYVGRQVSKDRIFTCPEDGCVPTFLRYSSMRRHKRAVERDTLFDKAAVGYAQT